MPDHPRTPAGASREEIAWIEVGQTTVSAATAWLLSAGFLAAIVAVPFVEIASLRAQAPRPANAWSRLARLPGEIRAAVAELQTAPAGGSPWQSLVVANRTVLGVFSQFELELEDESALGRTLRPPAQAVMTGWLGAGNERVYRGRDGWLFYRPDVEYVTGPGFLDPAELRRRVAAASEWETPPAPDPRPAIAGLHRDLEARGVRLIVVPTPVKPSVHPERLARRDAGDGVLQNSSYRVFVEAIERAGVLVFDPAEVLALDRAAGPQYLATDTHWRPEAMEAVAERLAAFITARVELPATPDPGYRVERRQVSNPGDTARMLDLPAGTRMYPAETVWLRRVLLADGSAWRPSRNADVLVLGDSFSNIYALASMEWGTSAGLVEQLSYALRRPVDRLVQNDQGAFATRAMLWSDLERLDGTRVVVYQFAARELAFGDWRALSP